jgi:hypothetical protein
MYNQALIFMRCVVAAEEYNMARHALPSTVAPSQDARDALGRGTAHEQRQRTPQLAKTDHPGATGPEWPYTVSTLSFGSISRPPRHQFAA